MFQQLLIERRKARGCDNLAPLRTFSPHTYCSISIKNKQEVGYSIQHTASCQTSNRRMPRPDRNHDQLTMQHARWSPTRDDEDANSLYKTNTLAEGKACMSTLSIGPKLLAKKQHATGMIQRMIVLLYYCILLYCTMRQGVYGRQCADVKQHAYNKDKDIKGNPPM